MKTRGRGVIVNVIGNAGNLTPADIVASVTADTMLEVLTRTLGGVSLDHGIRVVGVSPGDMMNERDIMFLRHQAEKGLGDPDRWRERLAELPGGRAGTSGNFSLLYTLLNKLEKYLYTTLNISYCLVTTLYSGIHSFKTSSI